MYRIFGGVLKLVRIRKYSFVPTQYFYFPKPRRSPPLEILLEILLKTKKIAT